MRRTIFIAAAVILALVGSAFAAASPSMDSPYRKMLQRVRVLAIHTIDAPMASTEKLDWATILKANNTVDVCNKVIFEFTRYSHDHIDDCSKSGTETDERHAAFTPTKASERINGSWWEPREPQTIKPDAHNRAKLWGRDTQELTASGDGIYGV